jgi:L-iditol 2-dehydrogenase
MLAAVYHGPNDLRVEDVPVPKIGKGELLVKVMSASICGTDLRIYHGNHRMYVPGTVRIPGHEVVGTIAEVGAEIKNYSIDQRVFCAPNTGCGHCQQCITGNNNHQSAFLRAFHANPSGPAPGDWPSSASSPMTRPVRKAAAQGPNGKICSLS